jgi:hypothetical protein
MSGVTIPQVSITVAVPSAAFITDSDGLQPNVPLVGVPVAVLALLYPLSQSLYRAVVRCRYQLHSGSDL